MARATTIETRLYAMRRMSVALQRAAAARPLGPETDRALRWATAWGMVAGIRTPQSRVRLRRSVLAGTEFRAR